jgi:hypothetical protein
VVFDHREGGCSTLGVLEPQDLFGKKGKTFTTIRSREGVERISEKPFGSLVVGKRGVC